jgi:heme o synthase
MAMALTGFTGMVLSGRGLPDMASSLACMASLVLAAAGSAILNVLLEAPTDARMKRLERRVAAMERVGRPRALLLALIFIACGLIVARLCLNPHAALLLLAAILFYSLIYTLWLKRSAWGAVPGALTGALPVLIGSAAVGRPIGPDGWVLFLVMLLWQPPHFWTLALRYREDFETAGMPVLPTILGARRTKALILLGNSALIAASLLFWATGYCSAFFAVAALLSGGGLLTACCLFIIKANRFGLAFRCSIIYLIVLLLAIISDICLVQGPSMPG